MKKLFFIILLIIPTLCFSQRYLWQRSYGTNKDDFARKMFKTLNNNFLLASSGYDSITFFWFDSAFQFQTLKRHHKNYGFHDITETLDGGLITAGAKNGPYIVRYNRKGELLWKKDFIIDQDTYFNKIIQLSDSGFLIRYYYSTSHLGMTKVNSKGDSLWNIKLTPTNLYPIKDTFIAIHSTYFKKFTNDGKLVYDKQLKLPIGVGGIYPAKGGYVLLGGFYTEEINRIHGMAMALVNYQGDTMWTGRYAGGLDTYARDIQQTADSGFLIMGESNGIAGSDIILVKVDKYGKKQWSKALVRLWEDENAIKLELNCDSSIIVLGNATNGFLGGRDVMLLKIDRLPYVAGKCVWEEQYHKSFLKEKEIVVYPNPVKEELNIRTKDPFTGTATITNLLGQVVANYNFTETTYFNLPFSAYSPGLYILTLTDPENKEVKKIKLFKH